MAEKTRGSRLGRHTRPEVARPPLWHGVDAGASRRAADSLQLDGPCRIADIACGGDGTSPEILRRAPAGSVVHGFDMSPGLIEAARGRVPTGERNLAFE